LTLYAHKLHEPELALCYCDRIYLAATLVINGKMTSSPGALHQPDQRASLNIYLTLLQVYLNPQKSTKEFDRTIATLTSFRGPVTQKYLVFERFCVHIVNRHLLNYTEPTYQRYMVRIIFTVPVYATMSFTVLVMGDKSIYFYSNREKYKAWVIYNFLSLCCSHKFKWPSIEAIMESDDMDSYEMETLT